MWWPLAMGAQPPVQSIHSLPCVSNSNQNFDPCRWLLGWREGALPSPSSCAPSAWVRTQHSPRMSSRSCETENFARDVWVRNFLFYSEATWRGAVLTRLWTRTCADPQAADSHVLTRRPQNEGDCRIQREEVEKCFSGMSESLKSHYLKHHLRPVLPLE